MGTITYLLPEADAHALAANLRARDYAAKVPPKRLAGKATRVVVTVEDGQEVELQKLVSRLAPDARRDL